MWVLLFDRKKSIETLRVRFRDSSNSFSHAIVWPPCFPVSHRESIDISYYLRFLSLMHVAVNYFYNKINRESNMLNNKALCGKSVYK